MIQTTIRSKKWGVALILVVVEFVMEPDPSYSNGDSVVSSFFTLQPEVQVNFPSRLLQLYLEN